MTYKSEDEGSAADDSALRDGLKKNGFKPNADGLKWMAAKPKVLVAGAYKVIRTAAERARDTLGKSK
jgi:hypothetical protein